MKFSKGTFLVVLQLTLDTKCTCDASQWMDSHKKTFGIRPTTTTLIPPSLSSEAWNVDNHYRIRQFMSNKKSAAWMLTSLRGGDDNDVGDTTVLHEEKTEYNEEKKDGSDTVENEEEDIDLEDKVHAAMRRLGLAVPGDDDNYNDDDIAVQNKEDHNNKGKEEAMEMKQEGTSDECVDGVCPLPETDDTSKRANNKEEDSDIMEEDVNSIANRISEEMNVDVSIAMAALGASRTYVQEYGDIQETDEQGKFTKVNEEVAREMIQVELDAMERISADSNEVKKLMEEGYDEFLCRRALAFTEMNVDDARAILIADEEDAAAEVAANEKIQKEIEEEEAIRAKLRAEAKEKEEQEKIAQQQQTQPKPMKTIAIDTNFDPTQPSPQSQSSTPSSLMGMGATNSSPTSPPPPAKKEDVVFSATSDTFQSLVIESPVPVLLDVYADWCGPCKALTPILEEMAVKGGGVFRLVKLNTDEERPISTALGVTALPTVFAVRNGKILNSFRGMPPSEQFIKSFMMGLIMGDMSSFDPKVTEKEMEEYESISVKLVRMASASKLSFQLRERLEQLTNERLDSLALSSSPSAQGVEHDDGTGMADAEETARVLRSLLGNIVNQPFEEKFRTVNLENKIIKARITKYPQALSILKSVGFANINTHLESDAGKGMMRLKGSQKVSNVAPCVVVRDAIDKWIDRNRRQIAAANRKKKDEIARAKLLAEAEEEESEYDEEADGEKSEDEVNKDTCSIKLRIAGKNKIHDLKLHKDQPLSSIIDSCPTHIPEGEEVQITCTARRLIVKSNDTKAMDRTIEDHSLMPGASIVLNIGIADIKSNENSKSSSSLKERAAKRQSRKKGEHTMASVGIYSKDDNAKGELIDGGGGVWYEHDVSDSDEDDDDGPGEDDVISSDEMDNVQNDDSDGEIEKE